MQEGVPRTRAPLGRRRRHAAAPGAVSQPVCCAASPPRSASAALIHHPHPAIQASSHGWTRVCRHCGAFDSGARVPKMLVVPGRGEVGLGRVAVTTRWRREPRPQLCYRESRWPRPSEGRRRPACSPNSGSPSHSPLMDHGGGTGSEVARRHRGVAVWTIAAAPQSRPVPLTRPPSQPNHRAPTTAGAFAARRRPSRAGRPGEGDGDACRAFPSFDGFTAGA